MKNTVLLILANLIFLQLSFSQKEPEATEVWYPEARVVTTGKITSPPSDAIVLFDGTNFNEWVTAKDQKNPGWKLADNAMTVVKGTGDIMTKKEFGDIQLHIEWRTPSELVSEGQGRGNSGVFLQSRYEVQVLDSQSSKTYSNGQAGAIYKQSIPLVNACKKPGEWQVYDIIYTAPKFNKDGIKVSSAYITVLHNGVLIQNHSELQGTSEYIGLPKNIAHGDDGIQLQDHGNPTSFRNIWIRKL